MFHGTRLSFLPRKKNFFNEKFRLVNAATGTGKTVAYLAPIIHHLQGYENRIQRSDGTFGAFCFYFEQIFSSFM